MKYILILFLSLTFNGFSECLANNIVEQNQSYKEPSMIEGIIAIVDVNGNFKISNIPYLLSLSDAKPAHPNGFEVIVGYEVKCFIENFIQGDLVQPFNVNCISSHQKNISNSLVNSTDRLGYFSLSKTLIEKKIALPK